MKKVNRLLSFLLAFTVVITTFSSDYTAAHVYATQTETLENADDTIKTADWESVDDEDAATNASTEETEGENTEEPKDESSDVINEDDDADSSNKNSTETTNDDASQVENKENADKDGDVAATDNENVAATEATTSETIAATTEATTGEDADASDEEEKFDSDAKDLKATVDGIDIILKADAGVLPEDAQLEVSKVSSYKEDQIQELIDETTGEDVAVEETISFDINISSDKYGNPENNKYVQPRGSVEVSFESVDEAKSEDVALSVYHVTDDIDVATPMSGDVTGTDTEVSIETTHFSIYTITITLLHNKENASDVQKFNISFYDDNNKPLTNIKEVEVEPETIGDAHVSPSDLAKRLGIDIVTVGDEKYEFVCARDGGSKERSKVIDYFFLKLIKGKKYQSYYKLVEGPEHDCGGRDARVIFYYKKAQNKNSIPLVVAVRTDGSLPDEPGIFEGNYAYLNEHERDGDYYDDLEKYIGVSDYTSLPSKTVIYERKSYQVYAISGVESVSKALSEDFIRDFNEKAAKKVVNGKHIFDPNKQYIEWYVIKYQENKDDKWHVDGVIRENSKLNLDYYANIPQNATAKDDTRVPTGRQYKVGGNGTVTADVLFDKKQDKDGYKFIECEGYTFLGWDENPQATVPKYTKNGTKKITFSVNTKLYAIWQSNKVASSYTIKYLFEGSDGKYQENSDYPAETVTEKVFVGEEKTVVPDNSKTIDSITYSLNSEKSKTSLTIDTDATKNVIEIYYDRQGRKVFYYVLYPQLPIPKDASGQPTENYYPPKGDDYHLWSGKAKNSDSNVYDVSGEKVTPYILSCPSEDINTYIKGKYGNSAKVTWYVYKNANDSEGWHIDGYLTGVPTSVVYDKNDGTQSPDKYTDNTVTGDYSVLSDSDEHIAGLISREGYEFKGWALNREPGKDDTIYHENDTLTIRTTTILYAQWEKKSVSVEFVNDDDSRIYYNNELKYGELTSVKKNNDGSLFVPTKAGDTKKYYEFKGWVKVPAQGEEADKTVYTTEQIANTPLTGDVKYKATYEEAKFEAYYNIRFVYQDRSGNFYDKKHRPLDSEMMSDKPEMVVVTKKEAETWKVSVPDEYTDNSKTYTHKNNVYYFVSADSTKELSAQNTAKNPLILEVRYGRNYTGINFVITSKGDTKVYDGTALTKNEYEYTVKGYNTVTKIFEDLKDRFTVSDVVIDGKQIGFGSSHNNISAYKIHDNVTGQDYIYDEKHRHKTDDMVYYIRKGESAVVENAPFAITRISKVEEPLVVMQRPVKIIIPDGTKVYDGKAFSAEDYDKSKVSVEVTYTEAEKAAGKTPLNMSVRLGTNGLVFANGKKNVSDSTTNNSGIFLGKVGKKKGWDLQLDGETVNNYNNYMICYDFGDITILPKEVILKSADKSKPFDGNVLVNGDMPLAVGPAWADVQSHKIELVKGEYVYVEFTGSLLKAGTTPNSFTLTKDKNSTGILKLFAKGKKTSVDYNNYKFISADGKTTYTENSRYTVGTDTYRQFGEFGTLTVTENENKLIKITVDIDKTGKNEKTVTYNGKDQNVKVSVTVDHDITVITPNEEAQTEAPVEQATPDQARADRNSVLDKILSFGTLTVYAAEEEKLIDNTTEYTFTYGGNTFVVSGIEVVGGNGTNVGDYYATINTDNVTVTLNGEDVKDQFDIKVKAPDTAKGKTSDKGEIAGVLHIVPAHVTVTASNGLSKTAGTADPAFVSALVVDDSNITAQERDAIKAEAEGSVVRKVARTAGESAGTYAVKLYGPNNKEYTVKTDDPTVQGNFVATYVPGTFTITAAPVIPVNNDETNDNDNDDDDDDDDRSNESGTTQEAPVFATMTAAPAVLGAVRGVPAATGDAPAVLGARRAGTDDTSILGSIITIIVAAAIAFSMVFIKRKKKEEK